MIHVFIEGPFLCMAESMIHIKILTVFRNEDK